MIQGYGFVPGVQINAGNSSSIIITDNNSTTPGQNIPTNSDKFVQSSQKENIDNKGEANLPVQQTVNPIAFGLGIAIANFLFACVAITGGLGIGALGMKGLALYKNISFKEACSRYLGTGYLGRRISPKDQPEPNVKEITPKVVAKNCPFHLGKL